MILKRADKVEKRIKLSSLSNSLKIGKENFSIPSGYPTFPWPPPQASARDVIPKRFFSDLRKMSDVNTKLSKALRDSGYIDKGYFAVPKGFAIATGIEQIYHDGRSKKYPYRWSVKMRPLQYFSLSTYLKELFTARIGYYRVIVFTITLDPFVQLNKIVTRQKAIEWAPHGANRLDKGIGMSKYTSNYLVTAHIYIFKQREFESPVLIIPSDLTGKEHLIRSKVTEYLEN